MENQELIQQMKLGVLKDTFTSNPGTIVRVKCEITSRLYKLFLGIKSGDKLSEVEYINGDLVMETTEAVCDGVNKILYLRIVDTKAGLSGPSKVDKVEDLRSILSIMNEQRKIESEREQAA